MACYFLEGLMLNLNFLRSVQDIRAFKEKELEAHQGLGSTISDGIKLKPNSLWASRLNIFGLLLLPDTK